MRLCTLTHMEDRIKTNMWLDAIFLFIMQENQMNIFYHKLLVCGHSHMELPMAHTHDWYQLVHSVDKNNKFRVRKLSHTNVFDFAGILKWKS
ncbi:hypothetical protein PR048_011845, partial [Dryococelus australis]